MKTETLHFKDINFKLAVINEIADKIAPNFSARDFAKNYTKRTINIEEEGYDIIPEILEYFKNLEITSTDVADIEEICQDPFIYNEIYPFWDGECDTFNIQNFEDVDLLPNLKSMTLFYDEDESILEALQAKGIEAEWM